MQKLQPMERRRLADILPINKIMLNQLFGDEPSPLHFRFQAALTQKTALPSQQRGLCLSLNRFHLHHIHLHRYRFHARHIAAAQTRCGHGLPAFGFGCQRGGIGFHKLQT